MRAMVSRMIRVPSDSYVSIERADAYHSIRPSQAEWAVLETSQKELRLVAASDYVDACYQLRNDLNRKMRAGDETVIEPVYKAVCELALKNGLFDNGEQKRRAVTVADISVTYSDSTGVRFEYVDALLAPYIKSSFNQIPLYRG